MQNAKRPSRLYNYEARVMWNTALPLVENRRENNHLKNIERVALFDELGFYKITSDGVAYQKTKGGRGVRGVAVQMAEELLAILGTEKYQVVIKNLFKKKYMTSREVKFALRHCSTLNGATLTDNEITLLIKSWV